VPEYVDGTVFRFAVAGAAVSGEADGITVTAVPSGVITVTGEADGYVFSP
jgi:hypothetical protein